MPEVGTFSAAACVCEEQVKYEPVLCGQLNAALVRILRTFYTSREVIRREAARRTCRADVNSPPPAVYRHSRSIRTTVPTARRPIHNSTRRDATRPLVVCISVGVKKNIREILQRVVANKRVSRATCVTPKPSLSARPTAENSIS